MLSAKNHPTIALASCTKSAVAYATSALVHSGHSEVDIIINSPLFPNALGYVGFKPLIETVCTATNALLWMGNGADLAVSVSRELVSYRSNRGRRHTFSVGLIVACYEHGPLFVSQAGDWIKEEDRKAFMDNAQEVIDRLQKDAVAPPDTEIVDIAKLLATRFMLLPLSMDEEEVSVH